MAVSGAFVLILINFVVLVGFVRSRSTQSKLRPTPTPTAQRRVSAPAWEVETPTTFDQKLRPAKSRSFVPLFIQPRNPATGEPIGYTNPFEFIENLIFVAMAGGMFIAFFMLLKGAYLYMTSEGDFARMEKAKKMITMALVGVGIIALSSAILSAVGVFFGLNFFDLSDLYIPGPSNYYSP